MIRLLLVFMLMSFITIQDIQGQGFKNKDYTKFYNQNAIYTNSFYILDYYIKDGKRNHISLFSGNLQKEISSGNSGIDRNLALKSYKKYKVQKLVRYGLFTTSLISYVLGVNELVFRNSTSTPSDYKAFKYLTISSLAYSIAIPLRYTSKNKLNKAIWHHNRNKLLEY